MNSVVRAVAQQTPAPTVVNRKCDGNGPRHSPLVRVVLQRRTDDCGVATLAMLLNVTYDDVWTDLMKIRSDVPTDGISEQLMRRLASMAGYDLQSVPPGGYPVGWCHGIIGIDFPHGDGHWAFTSYGYLYDTDGYVWVVEDYLAYHQVQLGPLLTLADL